MSADVKLGNLKREKRKLSVTLSICRKYEKLQSEAGKTDDKSLKRELSDLEKELNVKEEEINAVIGIYKEVRAHCLKYL